MIIFSYDPTFIILIMMIINNSLPNRMGSRCGSVCVAVASDTRGPWFKSQSLAKNILKIFCDEKKNKKKRPRMTY